MSGDWATRKVYRSRRRRQLRLLMPASVLVTAVVLIQSGLPSGASSFALPSRAALAGLSVRHRIVMIARSQLGYRTDPTGSYCNKFSAYWGAEAAGCPGGEAGEEWCADFAAWVWRSAGVTVSYGFGAGELNAGAASFYAWGIAHGTWHSASSGYRPRAGDAAVYGLTFGAQPSAAHVAIVTGRGRGGPEVINGDGNRTGFSVVDTGAHQSWVTISHHRRALLAGYVSP